jgi:YVTN family beta-propeller protein
MADLSLDPEVQLPARRGPAAPKRITLVLGVVLAMLLGTVAISAAPASAADAVLSNVSASITVESKPIQLAVNSTGSKVYAINSGSNSVSVIDTATNTVTATISTGTGLVPQDLVLTRDDSKLFVTYITYLDGYADNGGYVEISTASNTVTYTSGPLDYAPSGVAVSADGAKLFINTYQVQMCDPFGCYLDSSFMPGTRIISTSTRSGLGWVPTDGRTEGLALSPDGSFVYRVDASSQRLEALPAATGSGWSVDIYTDGPRIVVSPDSSTVYVASYGYVAIVDAVDQKLVDVKSVSNSGVGIAISPDGSYLYLSDIWGPKVRVVSTSDFSVVATVTLPTGSKPWGIAAAPNGSSVYVASNGTGAVKVLTAAPSVVVPSAPTELNATPGNGSASVSFTAGADGGASITKYQFSIDGGTNWSDASGMSSPVTVTGLTNGTAYTVKLRAVNSVGSGAESVASASFTPRTTPSAPTSLVATPGDSTVSVAFTAGSDGGASISNYEYQLNGSGSWYAFSPAVTSGPVSIPVTNGVAYTVKLRAVNAAGSGAASDASDSFTPRTTPSAPTDLVATPGDGSASIAFTAGSDGGAVIMNYRYSIDDGATWLAFPEMVMSSPVTIPGLTNFTTYNVKLRAVNSAGDGAASSSVSVTPAIAGPTSCSAIALTPQRVQTCWNPFTPSQGSLIRVRTELYLAGTNTVVRTCVSQQVSQTSCVFGALARNTAYDVRVRARIRIAPRKVFFTLATTQQVTTLP